MPFRYGQEVRDAIIAGLANGRSLRAICRDAGMPDERAVRKWSKADPVFGPQ